MRWIKNEPTPEPVTPKQAAYIKAIEEALEILGVFFDGTTKQQASVFIDKYANYYRDMLRISQGKRPWWSMIANLPPKAPEIHQYFVDAYDYHDVGEHYEDAEMMYMWGNS